MVQDAPPSLLDAGQIDDLDRSREDVQNHLRRSIRVWVIRWAIGFAVIWSITSWTGSYGWLWPVGASVAAASLAFTLGAHLLVTRRMNRTPDTAGKTGRRSGKA